MKAVLSGKEMKEFDARSIKGYGIPSLVLIKELSYTISEGIHLAFMGEEEE